MTTLLNPNRPPFFCPGCSHERVVHALDRTFGRLGLAGNRIAIVTDIGCSGLFDTFFDTHALHGLHGRALTYATGLKLACPDLTVVVIMGDGGLGIGGAHVLSSCRRNLDLTLLVLNNFNYGMTGGQCSATTPTGARTASGFLGQLEAPLDICAVGAAAGATWLARSQASDRELSGRIGEAILHPGFALIDITGVCPGRFSKMNRKPAALLDSSASTAATPAPAGPRPEYGREYRKRCGMAAAPPPLQAIEPVRSPTPGPARSVLILGAAGQRVNTGAEVLCLAAMYGGLQATQKNDYPITVLRGHSISEVILGPKPIRFTGIDRPDIILALAPEGVERRSKTFSAAGSDCLILRPIGLELPDTDGRVVTVDLQGQRLAANQRPLALLALLAGRRHLIDPELLGLGLRARFAPPQLDHAIELVKRCLTMEAEGWP